MASSTKDKILRELARLRMEQQDGDPNTLASKTELAHEEINRLLDQLEAEHSHSQRVPHVSTSP